MMDRQARKKNINNQLLTDGPEKQIAGTKQDDPSFFWGKQLIDDHRHRQKKQSKNQ